MSTRTSRFQVEFTTDGDGKVRAAIKGVGEEAEKGAKRAASATDMLSRAYKGLLAVLASKVLWEAGTAYVRMADASANMTARLRLATKSQQEFNAAHQATYRIAQATSTGLESVVDLYAKLAQSTGGLGLSQGEVLQMTETITQAFQVSGATAQEAAGGLRQLGQAMAGGTLRAEEFNSIIESSPRIVQALADHFRVEFGEVRKLVNEGKISSEDFARAMLSASTKIRSEFDKMPLTVSRAVQEMRNALTRLVGGADEASGASTGLAESIQRLAQTLESPGVQSGFNSFVGGVTTATGKLAEFMAFAANVAKFWGEEFAARSGGAALDDPIRLEEERKRIAARLGELGAFQSSGRVGRALSGLGTVDPYAKGQDATLGAIGGNTVEMAEREMEILTRRMGEIARAQAQALMKEVKDAYDQREESARTQGLAADFGVNFNPNGRAGGGAKDIKDRTNARKELTAAEREALVQQADMLALQEYTEELSREYANNRRRRENEKFDATQGLIQQLEFEAKLIGLTNVERAKEIALRQLGADATEKEKQRVVELVEAIHDGTDDMSEFARQAARNMQDAFADFLFDPFEDGLDGMLDKFADTLRRLAAEVAAQQLFNSLGDWGDSKSGSGGWLGTLGGWIGSFFGGGKASGGGVSRGSLYEVAEQGKAELLRVNGKTLLIPGQDGTVTPAHYAAAGAGAMGGGGLQVEINNYGDNRVTTREERSRMPDGTELRRLVIGIIADDTASGGRTAAATRSRFGLRDQ